MQLVDVEDANLISDEIKNQLRIAGVSIASSNKQLALHDHNMLAPILLDIEQPHIAITEIFNNDKSYLKRKKGRF